MARLTSQRQSIMLVDDEQDIVSVLRRGLVQEGFEVDAFTDPLVAAKNFRPNRYSRVLIDVRMPGMSGFELARRISSIDKDTQICFLSSFEIHSDEARKVFPTLGNGGCFITKPISPSALAAHILSHHG